MPNEYTPFRLSLKEADEFSDLKGIEQDLSWVIDAGVKYVELRSKAFDPVLLEAFSIALMVRYMRPFKTGVRRKIPQEWLDEMPSVLKEAHKYFKSMRDKFFAHSVNHHEKNYAVVYIKNSHSSDPEFSQVQAHHERTVALSVDDVEKLTRLTKMLHAKVEDQLKLERQKVEALARKISISELMNERPPRPHTAKSPFKQ